MGKYYEGDSDVAFAVGRRRRRPQAFEAKAYGLRGEGRRPSRPLGLAVRSHIWGQRPTSGRQAESAIV